MAIRNEERIARMEAGYEHLATKADLADMRAHFKSDLAAAQVDTNRRIDRLFWAVIGIGGGLLAAAAAALLRDALA